MRESVQRDLSNSIEPSVVADLLDAFEGMIARHRAGDAESALTRAGKFVDHVFRALEFIRTGKAPVEIKSPAATARLIENDAQLPESVRLLIPRIALAMIYDLRSKRGAVHVKGIDPRQIDVTLSVSAASWILAEFIRLFHVSSEQAVAAVMASLTRAQLPFVEKIANQSVVTGKVPAEIEVLLLLADAAGVGLTRLQLGAAAKCSPASVTRVLQKLETDRFIHKAGQFFIIVGPGEAFLSDWLSKQQRFRR